MYYFAAGYAADVDGVNYTAVCESRGGICTRAADCETNSAVDLTGTGSRFRSSYVGDGVNSDQIRSFLCNLTAICCLPQPTNAGSLHSTLLSLSTSVSQTAIAYSMGQIIISVCVCQSLSVVIAVSLTQIFGYKGLQTMVNNLSCGMRMRAQFSFVLSSITRLTDGQTDRQTEFSSLDRVYIS